MDSQRTPPPASEPSAAEVSRLGGASSRPPQEPPAVFGRPVETLLRVPPARVRALERLGIRTVRDLVHHWPRVHEDRSELTPIGALEAGESVVVEGMLERFRRRGGGSRRAPVTGVLRDATGAVDLVWFHQPSIAEWIPAGSTLFVAGEVKRHGQNLQIVSPEFAIDTGGESIHFGRIVPVYPLTKGISQRVLRELVWAALGSLRELPDDPFVRFHSDAGPLEDALREAHFPRGLAEIERARARFAFNRQFEFASRIVLRRRSFRDAEGVALPATDELDAKIRSLFPFALTDDQDRAVAEITRDLQGSSPMYRLLQGDVGTGKTAVAVYALLVAVRGGGQGAILAPTEVLAEQHFRTVTDLLAKYPVRVACLTGSTKTAARREILAELRSGRIHLIVGTQALLQDTVEFSRLLVAIVDEQHRFGVRERKALREKGGRPHVLVMTATPIPRSLCMTCYGDLDLSTLRERPAGRPPVVTRLVPRAKFRPAVDFVRRQLAAGRQAYFVYPLVEESEAWSLPTAVERHERLARDVFPEFEVGLVHGRMAAAEKEAILAKFRTGEVNVLVATVVVEVGIDVPNATVIFIEDASRFGLAQLHQLRGRVGRGAHPGYCLVGTHGASREARARLEAFARTNDGFRLAEEDLRLRGPGDYLGLRQSGRPDPFGGHPLEDLERFQRVRELAESFWARPEHEPLVDCWGLSEESGGEFFGLD